MNEWMDGCIKHIIIQTGKFSFISRTSYLTYDDDYKVDYYSDDVKIWAQYDIFKIFMHRPNKQIRKTLRILETSIISID